MLRGSYRITTTAKVLLFQILLFSIGILCGAIWQMHNYNKKWDSLIYYGIKVSGLHLYNRTIKEDEALIKSQYIKLLLKRNISISVNNKLYTLENSKIIKKYNVESTIYKSPDLEKKFSLYDKSLLLKKGITQLYTVKFSYDENYIKALIASIEKDVNREAVNASIEKLDNGSIKVNPDIEGYKLEEDKLEDEIKDKLNSKNEKNAIIAAPVIKSKAVITADKLSKVNTNIASYTTNFSFSSYARSNNIELCIKAINGKILMPGEIFSFNDVVGERTAEKGYMEAPVLFGDKVDSGIGGGICQVSSTLYNAVLTSGIKPLEITHHTLPSSYVPLGLDATVDWNDIDFKFKNTLDYPIYIEAYTGNQNIYINIYSDSSLLNKKYAVSSNVYETIKSVTQTVEDAELSEGQTEVIQQGHDGYKVRVTRDTYENEKLVASELISDELYSEVPSIIRTGTKEVK